MKRAFRNNHILTNSNVTRQPWIAQNMQWTGPDRSRSDTNPMLIELHIETALENRSNPAFAFMLQCPVRKQADLGNALDHGTN